MNNDQCQMSVCTAVHPPAIRYIGELHASLNAQTYRNWEWVIACNGGATVPGTVTRDPRVRTIEVDGGQATSKAAACRASRGEVIIRIDADDLLPTNALELASAVPGGFRWGNWAPFKENGGDWQAHWYDHRYGWRYQDYWHQGHKFYEHMAFPISPLMIAGLYMQPAGFLAWTREAYFGAGGFDNEPQDSPEHRLVCRTYLNLGASGMSYIPECLHLYRQHTTNTSTSVLDSNESLAMHTNAYLEYIDPCCLRWCRDTGLAVLQLEEARAAKIALPDHCIGLLRTSQDDIPWDVLYRIMAPGGAVLVDHKIESEDPRFQCHHRSDAGTHFFTLKGAYASRPVGRLPVRVPVGVPVVDSAVGSNGGVKVPFRADPVPEVNKRLDVTHPNVDMRYATQQNFDQGCSRVDIFSGVSEQGARRHNPTLPDGIPPCV